MRFKVIESEIESNESKLEQIQEELANFDYASLSEEKSKYLGQLNEDQTNLENKILELYEEFEDLQLKTP